MKQLFRINDTLSFFFSVCKINHKNSRQYFAIEKGEVVMSDDSAPAAIKMINKSVANYQLLRWDLITDIKLLYVELFFFSFFRIASIIRLKMLLTKPRHVYDLCWLRLGERVFKKYVLCGFLAGLEKILYYLRNFNSSFLKSRCNIYDRNNT